MARVYLPFNCWPAADREAWAVAIAAGDVLDGRGPAYHWKAATRQTNVRHYARWLGFITEREGLAGSPASRVSYLLVKSYVAHLKVSIAPRTVVSSLVGLKVMMKAMAPDKDWRWLADICNRLNRNAEPSKDKRSRILDSGEVYRTALHYLERLAKTDLSKRRQLVGYRNGLMVALMAARPLRRKNFAELAIGKTLLRLENGWLIRVAGENTKNGQSLEFELPGNLVAYLDIYLTRVRAKIAKPLETALWVSWHGDQMPYHTVYIAFTRITKELFGEAINPHLFRDFAATTLASRSLKHAMAAPGLLGHKHLVTTEKHYIHARQLEASRKMNSLLENAAKK